MSHVGWTFGPVSANVIWTDPADGTRWQIDLTFVGPSGPGEFIECVGMSIRPVGHGENEGEAQEQPPRLTTTRLHRLNLATLIAAEKAKLASTYRLVLDVPVPWETEESRAGELARAARQVSRQVVKALEPQRMPPTREPGRPRRWNDEHFRDVARFYATRLLTGTPTKDVAEHWQVSPAMAKKWISRCRKMGLLGPTEPGRAGGVEGRWRKTDE